MEGKNIVAGDRLRRLNPTTAIADAITLHSRIKGNGTATDPPAEQIAASVPRLGHKQSAIDLLVLAVVYVRYLALPNDENGTIPRCGGIVDQRPRHE